MPPKESLTPRPHRDPRSKRVSLAIAAVLVLALVGTTASLALARGPVYALLARAAKPAHTASGARARRGSVSKASKVTSKATSGSRHFAADRTAPNTSIASGPAAVTTSTSASFGVAASEPNSTLACKIDGGGWASCASPKAYSGIGTGIHTFSARATDAAGNVDPTPAVQAWTVAAIVVPLAPPAPAPPTPEAPTPPAPAPPAPPADTTAPETSIADGPADGSTSTDASFAISSSESDSTFACELDDSSWAECSSPASYSNLTVGTHTFSVQATDAAGNTDTTPASQTWTVEAATPPPPPADTTPPETTITGGPKSNTTATDAGFSFLATEPDSTFACRLDSGNWAVCSSPKSYSGLVVGTHTFSVRATDAAGNTDTSPATQSWTVEAPPPPPDTTAPDTSITSGPSGGTTSTEAAFGLASTESGSTLACKLDSGSWASCSTPVTYTGLAVGSHAFSTRATDGAGNTDATPATRTWTVEAVVVTPPPPTGCTTTATSTSAAQSAVSSAAPGAVVCLADGSYSKLTLSATKAAPGVTVKAANPGKATVAGASVSGAHLTLAGFVVTDGVQIQPGSNAMTIEHNKITGGGQGIDGCPSSSTTCNDTRIIGNKLIGPFGEDAIHLNRYHDGDGDGVGILIEGNEITNVRENGNHSDCLQTIWVGDHITFRKNYLHDNRCQGFFVKDQASLGGVSGPIAGISVEDNLFIRNQEPCGPPLTSCGQPNYFQVFGPYSGFKMTRNTIWGDGDSSIATFREGTGTDTQIANNVIYRLWTDTNMSAATLANNTVCKLETGAGGSWASSRPGQTTACSLGFTNTAAGDYRLAGSDRGVDWAPAEQHFGP
jgi:hypothetical protein